MTAAKIGDDNEEVQAIEAPAPAAPSAVATMDRLGPVEREVMALKEARQSDQQIDYLLRRAMEYERTDQRDDDLANDHGIRLFSRQKNKSLVRILLTLLVLTAIYGIQLVALYNLNRSSAMLDTNVLVKWLERDLWSNPNIAMHPSSTLTQRVRGALNGSEVSVFDLRAYDFCLTPRGQYEVVFNIVIGLLMIYMFLFFDLWFVVFDMPLTKNKPYERHGVVMLLGVFWLVLMNSAVVTWLGVVSGFAVLANSGDFYSVLFQSLQLFIVLVIDDTVLPAVRFLVEEMGRLDEYGELKTEELHSLTHGSQYYKPGYGHSFVRLWRHGTGLNKFLAVVSFAVMVTIIVAPAVTTVVYATQALRFC